MNKLIIVSFILLMSGMAFGGNSGLRNLTSVETRILQQAKSIMATHEQYWWREIARLEQKKKSAIKNCISYSEIEKIEKKYASASDKWLAYGAEDFRVIEDGY